jgi:hypothetical protein
VKEEYDLKDERGDGENFPKKGVANVKGKVHRKGDDDCPREKGWCKGYRRFD